MAFTTLIRPAVLKLRTEAESGAYRRERDLHHHLTLCLHATAPLGLGQHQRVLRLEEPTSAKYNWSSADAKAGNVDFFFPRSKTALELNLDYIDIDKIKQDLIKLNDPINQYEEAVYFACAAKKHRCNFRDRIQTGFCRAIQALKTPTGAEFILPAPLHVVALELSNKGHDLWEAHSDSRSSNTLSWILNTNQSK